MTRLFIVFFMVILFSSCSSKTQNPIVLNTLPHYNKDKVNLYFVNSEISQSFMDAAKGKRSVINFSYKIIGKENTILGTNCYGQYSYNELEKGNYKIELLNSQSQLLGKREDNISLEKYLKKGETYIFKIQGNEDDKATAKGIVNFSVFSGKDLKLSLLEISQKDGINYINNGINMVNPIDGKRDFPIRAEDNKKNETCGKWY